MDENTAGLGMDRMAEVDRMCPAVCVALYRMAGDSFDSTLAERSGVTVGLRKTDGSYYWLSEAELSDP